MRLATEQNFVDAFCQLGSNYFTGNVVVPKDHRQSYLCFERAAELGMVSAAFQSQPVSQRARSGLVIDSHFER